MPVTGLILKRALQLRRDRGTPADRLHAGRIRADVLAVGVLRTLHGASHFLRGVRARSWRRRTRRAGRRVAIVRARLRADATPALEAAGAIRRRSTGREPVRVATTRGLSGLSPASIGRQDAEKYPGRKLRDLHDASSSLFCVFRSPGTPFITEPSSSESSTFCPK